MSKGALITLQDVPVVDLRLCVPRLGAWHVDAAIDTAQGGSSDFSGPLTLNVDGNTFACTVRRGGRTADVAVLRLVGGAGGLATIAAPKAYNGVTPQVVLSDLMATAGETLSGTIDPSLLATSWNAWTTPAWSVGWVLAEVVSRLGADVVWRVLPDGTVWLGRESWPTVSPAVVVTQVDDRLGKASLQLLDNSLVLPGSVFAAQPGGAGVKVDNAIIATSDGDRLVEEIWFQ